MFCKKCGKEIDDNAKFCDSCGQKTDAEIQQETDVKPKKGKLKLVLSIITFLIVMWILVVRLMPESVVQQKDPTRCDSDEVKTLLKDTYINRTRMATDSTFNGNIEFSSISELSSNERFKTCSADVTYGINNPLIPEPYNLLCNISYTVRTPDLLHISVEPNLYSNLEIINNCVPIPKDKNISQIKTEENKKQAENTNSDSTDNTQTITDATGRQFEFYEDYGTGVSSMQLFTNCKDEKVIKFVYSLPDDYTYSLHLDNKVLPVYFQYSEDSENLVLTFYGNLSEKEHKQLLNSFKNEGVNVLNELLNYNFSLYSQVSGS